MKNEFRSGSFSSTPSGAQEDAHPREEDLELYYLLRFSPHQISSIESHLSECALCEDKVQRFAHSHLYGAEIDPAHVPDMRVPLGGALEIRVIGSDVSVTGRILDICENEMKLGLREPLVPGAFAQTRIGSRIVMGQVRSCTRHGEEFHVSIAIDNIFLIPRGAAPDDDSGPPA